MVHSQVGFPVNNGTNTETLQKKISKRGKTNLKYPTGLLLGLKNTPKSPGGSTIFPWNNHEIIMK